MRVAADATRGAVRMSRESIVRSFEFNFIEERNEASLVSKIGSAVCTRAYQCTRIVRTNAAGHVRLVQPNNF